MLFREVEHDNTERNERRTGVPGTAAKRYCCKKVPPLYLLVLFREVEYDDTKRDTEALLQKKGTAVLYLPCILPISLPGRNQRHTEVPL